MCMSKISFLFSNVHFLEKQLTQLENEIIGYSRHWFGLNNSSARSFFFVPQSKGGAGLFNPRCLFYSKYLSFALSSLNSDDLSVRNTARASLNLHMQKRKVNFTEDHLSFAGYQVIDNRLAKVSKVNWPQSYWVSLFELCQRVNVKLKFSTCTSEYSFELENADGVTVILPFAKSFNLYFKEYFVKQLESEFVNLEYQGRIFRENEGEIDERFTSLIFKRHNLPDEIRTFICKCRLLILECNSRLNLYYPDVYSKNCKICNHPSDTVSHILNGCTKYKEIYQKRHNRICDIIFDKLSFVHKNCDVLKDSVLTPAKFHSTIDAFQTTHTRPDITIIDREKMTAYIVEISIPYDGFLKHCYQSKFDKYFPLSLELNNLGFQTQIVILIIGSTGLVHHRFTSGLIKLGICKSESKFLANYCSISACIGSYKVWKTRCRDIDL